MINTKNNINQTTLLDTSESGLTAQEVERRRAAGLGNEASQAPAKSKTEIIKENVFTPFNLLNFILFCVILFLSFYEIAYLRNGLFFFVAIINTVSGIVQELKARKEVLRLSLINQPYVYVIRDSEKIKIPTTELVVGDYIELYQANQIAVDARFVSGINFQVDESPLTGESDPVEKGAGDPLYSGSFVLTGYASAIVEKTGLHTYAAQISTETQKIKKPDSEIKIALDQVSKTLGVIILIIGTAMLISKLVINPELPYQEVLISTVAALVGMMPEGLVLLNAVAFVVGVIRLSQNNILVQRMSTIETLARMDTLCIDKTGTITSGEMAVKAVDYLVDFPPQETFGLMQRALLELGDSSSTIQAVLQYLEKSQMQLSSSDKEMSTKKLNVFQSEKYYSFSSENKWSGVEFALPKFSAENHDTAQALSEMSGTWIFGAPEFVLSKSQLHKYQDYINQKTGQAIRLLIVAQTQKIITAETTLPENLNVVCFFEIEDHIRTNAKETFQYFAEQKVDLKIISGDNPTTVKAIARKAGVDELDLDKAVDMSRILEDVDYRELVEKHQLFGRVTPFQKQNIIFALQENGHVVGMTGDGINDVPALKNADCSIAVVSGSDAAKKSADLVLLNNDLSDMIPTIYEGRRIINNIERAAVLFLTKMVYMSLLAFAFIFLKNRFPLYPIQMTLIGSATIGIPGFFLSLMPNKNRVQGHFLRRTLATSVPAGLTATIAVLLHQFVIVHLSVPVEYSHTITLYILLAVSMSVLWIACQPFNRYTILIWLLSLGVIIIAVSFFPKIFFLHQINIDGIKYLCLMIVFVFIVHYLLRKTLYHFILNKL